MRNLLCTCSVLSLVCLMLAAQPGVAQPKPEEKKIQPPPVAQLLPPVNLQGVVPEQITFVNDLMPLINKAGCNQAVCHGTGQGGFKLSLFGSFPQQDHDMLMTFAYGRYVNKVEPAKSLFLKKITGALPHQGGKYIEPGSPNHQLIVNWLSYGAKLRDEKTPELVAIETNVPAVNLTKGGEQTVQATAVYSDGKRKDVTAWVTFRSMDQGVTQVNRDGKIVARDFGQGAVLVRYLNRSAVVRVVVPQPLSVPFPAFPANNKIDELNGAKLKDLGLPPSDLCSDTEFLRRVFLDVIGILPTVEEVKAFQTDKDAGKRAKLIDRLLERKEFADFWSLKWSDLLRVKSELESNLWPNAVQAYHGWVRRAIAANMPFDQFARELLTSSGSNFRSPPANFYRAARVRNGEEYAKSAALAFMGVRLTCAGCHNHPSESWTRDDTQAMASFFSQIRIKLTREWKEEIVYADPMAKVEKAKPIGGDWLDIPPGEDARFKFAEWLIRPDNPYFTKNIVNRVWCWLMGRGIINEPDDLRPTNPPSNPALLAFLEQELVSHKYDLKHIYRLILNSRTYQLSSQPNQLNGLNQFDFARYRVKRMSAEQISDAFSDLTLNYESFSSYIPEPWTFLPYGYRASQVADGSITTSLLLMFGRPSRDTGYENERDCTNSVQQALFLLNSGEIRNRVAGSPIIDELVTRHAKDPPIDLVDEIYLMTLSRTTTPQEREKLAPFLETHKNNRRHVAVEVMWAVMNTQEFLTIR